MKLVLTKPGPWPVHWIEDGPSEVRATPSMLIGPLEVAVGSLPAWLDSVVAFERSAFTVAEIVRTSRIHSQLRWNVEIVESRVVAGNSVIERRLSYLYLMLEYRAAVVFRARPADFVAEVDRAVPVLASGRPSWSGVVALADLFR